MKLAITLFGRRGSPRFDVAPQMLIIDTAQNDDTAQQVLAMTTQSPFQRVQPLKKLHVDSYENGTSVNENGDESG